MKSHRWFRRVGTTVLLPAVVLSCNDTTAGPEDPHSGDPSDPGDPSHPPALSTVGRIAFTSTRDGAPHIYLVDADGSDLTRLVPGYSPAWSPDGRRVAFITHDGTTSHLSVIDSDGSGERRLVSGAEAPAWSPDGARIAFGRPPDIHVVNADGSGEVRMISAQGVRFATGLGAVRGLGLKLSDAAWSPDGTKIAFAAREDAERVWLVLANADGSSPRIVDPPASGGNPAWSPDGRHLVFIGSRLGLASVELGGSDPPRKLSFIAWEAAWSPDGLSLVYASPDGRCVWDWGYCPSSRIRVGDPASDHSVLLIPPAQDAANPDYEDFGPAWTSVRER
ncbi:MAG: hypothetical protein R3195_12255 [Gemmatimonadota bacterium]|nr:hypothetical protein [Gemmatimonadota bacterium]